MSVTRPSIVYGFHGTDEQVVLDAVLLKTDLQPSANDYDWLGNGIYFWENNLERANQYAVEASARKGSSIQTPAVIGAILDLGNCLDLLDQKHLDFLKVAYEDMIESLTAGNKPIPVNRKFGVKDFDFKARELDCAVIRYACKLAEEEGEPFDSVRAAFWEGDVLYPGAYFKEKNHIQLAIINPAKCIKGLFLPRYPDPVADLDSEPSDPPEAPEVPEAPETPL